MGISDGSLDPVCIRKWFPKQEEKLGLNDDPEGLAELASSLQGLCLSLTPRPEV